jgi:small subunit ribosomal protein S13
MDKTINKNKKSFVKTLMLNNFGFGKMISQNLCRVLGLNIRINPKILKKKQLTQIAKKSHVIISGKKLKEKIKESIDLLIRNRVYKGIRHKLKYPARGQRTHTNAKTKKKFKY